MTAGALSAIDGGSPREVAKATGVGALTGFGFGAVLGPLGGMYGSRLALNQATPDDAAPAVRDLSQQLGRQQTSTKGKAGSPTAGSKPLEPPRQGPPPRFQRTAERKLSPSEAKALTELFGRNEKGIEQLLRRLRAGEQVDLPEGVTLEMLKVYRQVADDAIANGIDTRGVQVLRREAIDLLLKQSEP